MAFERYEVHKLLHRRSQTNFVSQNSLQKVSLVGFSVFCFVFILIAGVALLGCPMADATVNSPAMPAKHILCRDMGFPYFGCLLEISPSLFFSFELWKHLECVLELWNVGMGLEVWHNPTGVLVCKSYISRSEYGRNPSHLFAVSEEFPIFWVMLMALLLLLAALPTQKNKSTANVQKSEVSPSCFLERSGIRIYSTDHPES